LLFIPAALQSFCEYLTGSCPYGSSFSIS
jgi:hypothetical protein